MSAETASNTKRVYVRLLGEGTNVYRPTIAVIEEKDVARLMAPDHYDADDEEWEFKPGALVLLESRILEGREELVAVSLIK